MMLLLVAVVSLLEWVNVMSHGISWVQYTLAMTLAPAKQCGCPAMLHDARLVCERVTPFILKSCGLML